MDEIRIGLIGGSGLGEALGRQSSGEAHNIDTPFGKPSAPILETNWNDLPVFFLSRHGDGHLLNPTQVPYRANIFALKKLGVTHILASGAVGSLRDDLKPRHLVIVDQLIDKTSRRHGTFFDEAAVHVEFAEPFCPVLRQILIEAGSTLAAEPDFAVHRRGTYVAMEGPAFSTRAESHMHRLWGGDLIGMTLMPEAKLAREAEIAYAAVAMVTDFDCWKPHIPAAHPQSGAHPTSPPDPASLLNEILSNLESATDRAISLVHAAVRLISQRRSDLPPSPAHSALKLAIWSNKSRINPQTIELLAPIWIKYFSQQS